MKRRKKSKTKLYIFIVLILVVVGIVGVSVVKGKKDNSIEVTAVKVERRDVTSVVSATGRIYPEVEVKISSEVAGEIIELPVVEGQKVSKGDLLVKINPDRYETQVSQRSVSINSAKVRELEAKAQRLQAEQDLRRIAELHTKGFSSEKELSDAQTILEIRKTQEDAAKLEIERMESLHKEAVELLSKTVVYAPMDGTISKLDSELGERVVGTGQFQGTEIMRVADLSNMEVRIEVSETDIVNVKVNDKTTVEVDALPDDKFEGFVTEISSSAASVRENNDQLTTFEVRIRLLEPSNQLRPGMTATADIETKTIEDAISVPLQAVTVRKKDEVEKALSSDEGKEGDGGTVDMEGKQADGRHRDDRTREEKRKARNDLQRIVFVVVDGKVEMRKVETGIADNSHIVIDSGINEGEEVVSGSYQAIARLLKHESTVTVKEGFGNGGDKK